MKITPFQEIVKNEMSRLESICYSADRRIGGQIALQILRQARHTPTKNKHFLLQLFGYRISF